MKHSAALLIATVVLAAASPSHHLSHLRRTVPLPGHLRRFTPPPADEYELDSKKKKKPKNDTTTTPPSGGTTQPSGGGKTPDGCTFSGEKGAQDAMDKQTSCTKIVLDSLAVPGGVTLDLSSVKEGTQIIFKGTSTWGFKEWSGPLIRISGTGISVEGDKDSLLHFSGEQYWDGKGLNGGIVKAKAFALHNLTSSKVSGINMKNTPVQSVSINDVQDLVVEDFNIDNSEGNVGRKGHNTDGIDIGRANGLTISGLNVSNQDDCATINSGKNIVIKGAYCTGGHGMSVGSIGGRAENEVQNVLFQDVVIENSDNGCRIKTVIGKTGLVDNVMYKNVEMRSIRKFGILIEQNYLAGDLKGEPTSGVPITALTMSGVKGDQAIDKGGYNIAIVCGKEGACKDWTWENVTVSGGMNYDKCQNVPDVASCGSKKH